MAPAPLALVTGASSGIGLATAALLRDRGYDVVGTSRRPTEVPDERRLPGVPLRALDLADVDSVPGFCASLAAEGLAVDVLVNNAGESQSGPLEELPLGALRRVVDVNVVGPVHLTQHLLPGMRARGRGRVVMVGSMLATFPLAYRSSYVASKAALKGFATAARLELAPHGVWLTTVEPGSTATGISARRTVHVGPGSPYEQPLQRMLARLDRAERRGISPEKVARTVLEAVEADPPAAEYAVGSGAPVTTALRRVLPERAVERVLARRFDVDRPPRRG